MSQLLSDLNAYCRRYRISATDRGRLLAHYPFFKTCWLADYGGRRVKPLARLFCRGFRHYRFTHTISALGGRRMRIALPFDRYDLGIFKQIFWGDEYRYTASIEPIKTMIDLGANIGMASLWFWANNPGLERIIVAEPNPRILDRLRTNLATLIASGQAKIENICISDVAGNQVPFTCSPNHTANMMSAPGSVADKDCIYVPTSTLDVLLNKYDLDTLDLLKMDIEGAEHEVIRNPGVLKRCRVLAVEVHGSVERRHAFVQVLEETGFTVKRLPLPEDTIELVLAKNSFFPQTSKLEAHLARSA